MTYNVFEQWDGGQVEGDSGAMNYQINGGGNVQVVNGAWKGHTLANALVHDCTGNTTRNERLYTLVPLWYTNNPNGRTNRFKPDTTYWIRNVRYFPDDFSMSGFNSDLNVMQLFPGGLPAYGGPLQAMEIRDVGGGDYGLYVRSYYNLNADGVETNQSSNLTSVVWSGPVAGRAFETRLEFHHTAQGGQQNGVFRLHWWEAGQPIPAPVVDLSGIWTHANRPSEGDNMFLKDGVYPGSATSGWLGQIAYDDCAVQEGGTQPADWWGAPAPYVRCYFPASTVITQDPTPYNGVNESVLKYDLPGEPPVTVDRATEGLPGPAGSLAVKYRTISTEPDGKKRERSEDRVMQLKLSGPDVDLFDEGTICWMQWRYYFPAAYWVRSTHQSDPTIHQIHDVAGNPTSPFRRDNNFGNTHTFQSIIRNAADQVTDQTTSTVTPNTDVWLTFVGKFLGAQQGYYKQWIVFNDADGNVLSTQLIADLSGDTRSGRTDPAGTYQCKRGFYDPHLETNPPPTEEERILYTTETWIGLDGDGEPDFGNPTPGPSEGKTYQQQAGQPLCMRTANNVQTVAVSGHEWLPVSSIPGYLGDHAMQAEPATPQLLIADPNATPSPRMDFSANFVETGTHYVWLRGIQPGGDSQRDSCHVGINGTSPTLGLAARILPGGSWLWSGEQFQTGLRLEVDVPTTGPHTISVWMRENGTPIDSIVLSTSVDFVPTDDTPESGVAIEITDVRLSDITANGATINATFQGEDENVIPTGFNVELQGVGVLPGLPYVDSSKSDTAAPDAPVLSAQLDADGDTIHLTATLVADNAPDYSATIRGRDTAGNTGQWVTSDTVTLLPSGLDKYNFERRENGGEWVPLVSVSPTDPTLVDDTDPWAGVIEHRVFAVDLQANQTGSNETQIVEGQVTTTTVDTITDNSFVVHVQTLAGFDVVPVGETVEVMVTDAQGVETTYTPGSLPLTVTDYSDDVAPSAPAVTLIGSGATVSIIANAGEDLGAFVSVKARETVTQVWADWSPTVSVQMASSGFAAMYLEYQINQGTWNPADIIGTSDPFIWSQTIESNQVITVRVRQEDGAGNLSDWSAEKSYTYTTQVGEIVMHAPALINPDNVV